MVEAKEEGFTHLRARLISDCLLDPKRKMGSPDRPVDPQTAGAADALAGGTAPSREAMREIPRSQFPRIRTWLIKVRHVGCPSGASLQSFRQRDRADSRQSLTLLFRPLGRGCPFGSHCRQRESATGEHGAFGSSLLREQRGGDHIPPQGRVLHSRCERRTHWKVPRAVVGAFSA
jgi:hypothetical protein